MSKSLAERFHDVVKDVARPYPDYFHRTMPDIRRAMGPINDDHPFFDPDLIAAHDIHPQEWLKTHALGYAKETLAITGYTTHHAHGETAYIRCLISLNEHGHGAFGPALQDNQDITAALHAKRVQMEPFKPGPDHPAADLARRILGYSL